VQDRGPQDRAFQGPSPGAPAAQRGAQGFQDQGGRPNFAAPQQGPRLAGDQGPRGYDAPHSYPAPGQGAPRGYAAPGQGGPPVQNDRGGYAGGRAQGYAPDQGRPYGQNGGSPNTGGRSGVYGAPDQGRGHGQDEQGYDRRGYSGRQDGPQYRDRGQAFAFGGREYYRYRGAPYRFPSGYDGWSGHAWRAGEWLPPAFISTAYFIDDYDDFGLWEPDYGFQWIRVGSDAVLIDLSDGRVVDEVSGVYYY
jgi:Ni/Co efflux regulator RcnB